MKYFTFIDLNAIKEIIDDHRKNPGKRTAQRILAKNVCKLVHGPKGLELAERLVDVIIFKPILVQLVFFRKKSK